MSIPGLSLRRRISLLLLLLAAAPMRPAPIASWDEWPVGTTKDAYIVDNGSPLPKLDAGEMATEFGDAFARAFNFPSLPMNLARRWRLSNQRYDKYLKQLQVHPTWVGDLQSPAQGPLLYGGNNDGTRFEQPDDTYSYARVGSQRKRKREPSKVHQGARYRPSISAGVITNLGDFFNRLRANVHFAEHSQPLGEAESQLLEGVHPHQLARDSDTDDNADYEPGQLPDRKTSAKLLQSARSYRPSQKIRALVSRNPNGYRGAQFIDPSYMWLGLGK